MFLSSLLTSKTTMVAPEKALLGRAQAVVFEDRHFANGARIGGSYPEGVQIAYLAMGCFWGAERLFWESPGVHVTAVGYQGGYTPNPTYQETCTGQTGHTETVMVVFEPSKVSYSALLSIFFEEHDPTQGMRQGNDIGTVYRSAIYTTNEAQLVEAIAVRDAYQDALTKAGKRVTVSTEIAPAGPFYYAEDYHQQYLAKNPNGYCGLKGTGVSCPIPR